MYISNPNHPRHYQLGAAQQAWEAVQLVKSNSDQRTISEILIDACPRPYRDAMGQQQRLSINPRFN